METMSVADQDILLADTETYMSELQENLGDQGSKGYIIICRYRTRHDIIRSTLSKLPGRINLDAIIEALNSRSNYIRMQSVNALIFAWQKKGMIHHLDQDLMHTSVTSRIFPECPGTIELDVEFFRENTSHLSITQSQGSPVLVFDVSITVPPFECPGTNKSIHRQVFMEVYHHTIDKGIIDLSLEEACDHPQNFDEGTVLEVNKHLCVYGTLIRDIYEKSQETDEMEEIEEDLMRTPERVIDKVTEAGPPKVYKKRLPSTKKLQLRHLRSSVWHTKDSQPSPPIVPRSLNSRFKPMKPIPSSTMTRAGSSNPSLSSSRSGNRRR